jgi:hypothetical protein
MGHSERVASLESPDGIGKATRIDMTWLYKVLFKNA